MPFDDSQMEDQDVKLSLPLDEANLPTQDISNFICSPDSQSQTIQCNETKVWGKLFPMLESIPHQDLMKESYTFGRAKSCDIVFDNSNFQSRYLTTVSKNHFQITRENYIGSDGYRQTVAFLTDTSQNGTFVNAERVGKMNKRRLRNDDIISMSEPNKMKVYMYMDEVGLEGVDFPSEVVSKFAVSRTLGSGACGEVKMAFCKRTNSKFAIKIIGKKNFDYEETRKILNEIEILRKLEHPCVIRMKDFIDTPSKLYIVLELMEGGELLDRIRKKSGIPERQTKCLFYQVCLAVQYLHRQQIAHRDLKPENILLATNDDDTLVKVTDFGLSKLINSSLMKTFCGTLMYVAPEILKNNGKAIYTTQVDMWSLGVILYCCLSGLTPFNSKSSTPLEDQIIAGKYTFPRIFNDISLPAKNLIKQLMTVDPTKRINIDQVMDHSWFADRTMRQIVDKIFDKFEVSENVRPLDDNIERELVPGVAKRARISSD